MFGNKTEERLASLEQRLESTQAGSDYLAKHMAWDSQVRFLIEDISKLREDLDEHRSGSRALFERITDIFHTLDETIRLQDEKLDALAAFVGGRFVNQPAQPERVVVEAVESEEPALFATKLDGDEDVEVEIVWEDEDADEPDDEASEDRNEPAS